MRTIQLYVLVVLSAMAACKTPEDETRQAATPAPVTVAVADTSSAPALGIDISHYQANEIDMLDTLKRDQLSFIICKATEGAAYTDPKYAHNWSRIPQKVFSGAYHFYSCAHDPALQASHYLLVTHSLQDSDFPAIVDFEEGGVAGQVSIQKARQDLLRFLGLVEKATGRVPIIYTDRNVGSRYLDDPAFTHYPLWIADYADVPAPRLPAAWRQTKWALWQRSEKYTIDSDTSDFDVFNGNTGALRRYLDSLGGRH